jgi:serine/threonine protein kinase
MTFIEFVKGCLDIDPERRMSADQAYEHRFIREALELGKNGIGYNPIKSSREN